jgi:hypothetical protein
MIRAYRRDQPGEEIVATMDIPHGIDALPRRDRKAPACGFDRLAFPLPEHQTRTTRLKTGFSGKWRPGANGSRS